MTAGELCIRQLLVLKILEIAVDGLEDFFNGRCAQCPLAEEEFFSRRGVHLDACQACAFLSAVVLFLHHEIELVQSIHPRAIFLLIEIQRLQQSDHGNATFVFERFHCMMFYGEDRFACQEKGIYANLLMPLRVKRFLLQTLFAFCPKAVPFQRLGKVTNYFPFIVILHRRIVANHAPRHCFLRIHRAIQSEIRIFAVSLGRTERSIVMICDLRKFAMQLCYWLLDVLSAPANISEMNPKEMNISAALFDLDGVIIDTEPQYTEFWAAMGREFELPDANFAAAVKGQTLTYIFDTYFPEVSQQDFLRERLNEFERHMSYPYIPGAVRFVEGLREKGIPAAVVTSSNQAKMAQVYAAHPELKQLFTAILTSEDTPRSKPAPDCYLIAAERLQCPIRSCVVFEDSINGLRAARDSGAFVIGLSTSNPVEMIAPLSDKVIPHFEGFSLS